ncbi:hypothetical protein G6F17_008583 [Rhizopus arrhizus]|nr:hypothetical protein G6F21_004443 [Rhizopus arrhizus]KAG0829807.1 hypothetical protein G6F18_008446 [Rhizopus arrhizus]KAG0851907.1 hypothetical protein G6F17_008583 [Rhizopus arrhizus]KAG0897990.1 hypothetical protein G6F34_005987 [Rhizopus arrhizus]KAG0912744.1 hypothetical protein G6F33_005801 [Rhizopus arrhizus]
MGLKLTKLAYKNKMKMHTEKKSTTNNATFIPDRDFHTEESSSYWLPKDEEEQMRLTGQHFAIKELYQGNVLSEVTKIIDFKYGVSVLDVGCGSGAWLTDMALNYPNCTYNGCDIVEVANKFVTPRQFTLQYGNVLAGLPFHDNTFDFVQMRLLIFALREEEWPVAIKELLRVTKPGGIVQILEPVLEIPDKAKKSLYRFSMTVFSVCQARGQNPHIAMEIEKIFMENNNVKIIQSECRSCNTNTRSSMAKNFAWDAIQAAKSMMPLFSKSPELKSKQEQQKFLKELEVELTKTGADFCFNAVAAQKEKKLYIANQLFEVGAFILFLDAPPNLEFGIDYNAWTIGPLFKGVKLIPPDQQVKKVYKESEQVLVRIWNPQTEDLRDETELDPAQAERYRINIREFDRHMGPYPLDPSTFYERWKKLTHLITPGLVRRVLPNNGKVSHLPEKSVSLDQENVKDRRLGKQIEKEEGMEFTPFDLRKSFPSGASGDEVTRWSLDKSWLTMDLLKRVYHDDHKVLLGELQLAFVCLLMAQNFSGFNQWKQLVQLLCSCQELMKENPELFIDFMDVLQSQLDECPDDFFRDILLENNFISVMLKGFQQHIPGSQERLVSRYIRLKNFIVKKFEYDLPQEEEEEDEEDAPVIVDIE